MPSDRVEPTPNVAPFESCIACFKGDTRTGLVLRGEAEWHIAALHKIVGLSLEEAEGTFLVVAEHELGCNPGMVPDGRFDMSVRLCEECADQRGLKVATVGGDTLPGYVQGEAE